MIDDATSVIEGLRGLGTKGSRKVTIGSWVLDISPIGLQEEMDAYCFAGEKAGAAPTFEGPGAKTGPEYIFQMKLYLLSHAIRGVNGVSLSIPSVKDAEGNITEIPKYLRKIMLTWSSEVLDYLHLEYNRMMKSVAEDEGFEIPHKALNRTLDYILQQSVAMAREETSKSIEQFQQMSSEDVPEGKQEAEEKAPDA